MGFVNGCCLSVVKRFGSRDSVRPRSLIAANALLEVPRIHFYTSVAGTVDRCREFIRRTSTLQIIVNEESKDVPTGTTVAQLLLELNMQPRYLAVERNREIVPRAEHDQCVLQPDDRLEIVTLVGGG